LGLSGSLFCGVRSKAEGNIARSTCSTVSAAPSDFQRVVDEQADLEVRAVKIPIPASPARAGTEGRRATISSNPSSGATSERPFWRDALAPIHAALSLTNGMRAVRLKLSDEQAERPVTFGHGARDRPQLKP
jgi:hypothetical protein